MSIRVTVCESQGLDQQGLDKQPQCLFHVAKHEIKHPKQHSVKHVTFNKTLNYTSLFLMNTPILYRTLKLVILLVHSLQNV